MTGLSILLAFWAAFALALVSPGPNFAVILGTAMRDGRPAALRVALGMAAGEAVWGFGAVFGIAALTAQLPWLGLVLRVGGGLFLLWLAFGALRSAARRDVAAPATEDAGDPARPRGLARGFVLMLLNPKAGAFWVSLTSVFLIAGSAGVGAIAVAGAVALSLAWHVTLAFALSARAVIAAYQRLRRGLEGVLGVVLAGLGLRLMLSS